MSISVRTIKGADEVELSYPFTVDDAKSAIRELNGKSTNSLALSRDGNSLLVGNGPEEFTVTFMVGEMEHAYDLVGNSEAKGSKKVMLGVLTDYPVKFLVGRDAVERVAAEFVETGSVRLGQEWEDQQADAQDGPHEL